MAKRKRGRGSVRFRKDIKKFVIDYYDKSGKRHVETIGEEKKEAEKALTQRFFELDTGRFNYEQRKRGFETYANKWIERKTNIKESTVDSYKGHLKNHLIPYFGKMIMHEIRREDIHGLIKSIKEKGSSPKTIHNVLTTFHQILLDATVDGCVDKDPFVRIEKPKGEKPEIDILDKDEIKLLLQTLTDRLDEYFLLFKMAIETGLRQGELLGLKWEDFNWRSNLESYLFGNVMVTETQIQEKKHSENSLSA